MPIIVFDEGAEPQDILDAISADGVACVHGLRVGVRAKLRLVEALANQSGREAYIVCVTMDHPATELGYPYDESRISRQDALEAAQGAYEAMFPHGDWLRLPTEG